VTTGPLPAGLFDITVAAHDPELTPNGYLALSLINPFSQAIVDEDGDYVWWHEARPGTYMVTRALPSLDGASLLYLRENTAYTSCAVDTPENDLVRISLDGTEVETIPVGFAHHDFTELPDGTIAVIAADFLEIEGKLIEGARILEIGPDGTTETVWSVWDHYAPPEWLVTDDEAACDWLHANALHYEPEEDCYYLGTGWTSEIWKIDRARDEVVWRLGGDDDSTVILEGEQTTLFGSQHGFDLTDDGLVVHDNESLAYSRLVEYELDEDALTARQTWEHASTEQFYVYVLGDVERLDSGLTVATWSTAGQVDIVTEDHEVVWQLNVEMGGGIGYTSWTSTALGAE